MNKSIALITLAIILTATSALTAEYSATVKSVKDGDTIVVEISGKPEQLQLLGIDAPEDVPNPKLQKDIERTKLSSEQLIAIGKLATGHLAVLATPGQMVKVEADLSKRDTYGRIPAIVTTSSGRHVNKAMVEDGYAVVLGRFPFDVTLKAELQQQQQKAFAEKRGLWGSQSETTKAWSDG